MINRKSCNFFYLAECQFKTLRWILGWGKDAEPLEPADLVKSWKDAVHEMAEQIESN